ncbi:MAG: hypothetical protein LBR79_01240 [Oscillospiraceae bacterium]|nr:hypothetical protein [Oscillospiraceae bacterium]
MKFLLSPAYRRGGGRYYQLIWIITRFEGHVSKVEIPSFPPPTRGEKDIIN